MLVHSAIEELIAAAESQRQIIEGRQDGDDWVICRAFEDAFRHTFSSNNLTSYKQLRPEAQFVLLKWIHWLIHFPDPTIQALRQNYSPPDLIDFSIELEEAQSSCLGET